MSKYLMIPEKTKETSRKKDRVRKRDRERENKRLQCKLFRIAIFDQPKFKIK